MITAGKQVYVGIIFIAVSMFNAYLFNFSCFTVDFSKNIIGNLFALAFFFSILYVASGVLCYELYGDSNIMINIFLSIIFISASYFAHVISNEFGYHELNIHIVFGMFLYMMFMLFVSFGEKDVDV